MSNAAHPDTNANANAGALPPLTIRHGAGVELAALIARTAAYLERGLDADTARERATSDALDALGTLTESADEHEHRHESGNTTHTQ